jgi:hypothetical protein
LSFLKGNLVLFVLKQGNISFSDMLSSQFLIWVWAIVKSNLVPRTILMLFLLVVLTWVHHHSLRSDQYFCLVPTTYESIFLEHINKLVVEPINDILIFSMFEDIHIGHLALMLETCWNHLCVITKYEFWMLEVTFSLWFTCNCWKMSPWIWEEFSLFPRESSWIGHACADYSWDDRLLPPFQWKVPICTPSHWLIYSRTRKSSRPSLSSFTFFHQGLSSISLQEAPGVAVVFGQSQSYLSSQSSTL